MHITIIVSGSHCNPSQSEPGWTHQSLGAWKQMMPKDIERGWLYFGSELSDI